MTHTEPKMTPAQMASLLDAALHALEPLIFLDSTVVIFRAVGRAADATAAAWIECLLAEGEVEILMGLRAAWHKGEARSPAEAAQRAAQYRLGVD